MSIAFLIVDGWRHEKNTNRDVKQHYYSTVSNIDNHILFELQFNNITNFHYVCYVSVSTYSTLRLMSKNIDVTSQISVLLQYLLFH